MASLTSPAATTVRISYRSLGADASESGRFYNISSGAFLLNGTGNLTSCCTFSSRKAATRTTSRHAVNASVSLQETELEQLAKFSEIVPDTVVGDDFKRFKPTAATVSASLILGISSLPEAKYDGAIESALAYGECMVQQTGSSSKFSCFLDKALVNVGAELVKEVEGRVSTEVDPRVVKDAAAIVEKVHSLLHLYEEVEVPKERVLFKIPATWEGIQAARQLEKEGIQTHLTAVACLAQAAAATQGGVSVIQIPVGRMQDWSKKHPDQTAENGAASAADAGVELVKAASSLISKNGYPTKVMASNIRTKEDVLGLAGVDYLVVPLKLLESLQSSSTSGTLHPTIGSGAGSSETFSSDELESWNETRFASEVSPMAKDLVQTEIDGAILQTERVEQYFAKIWPPPNV